MEMNIYALLVAGLIPMIIGFIWYNERVFGKKWMRVAEMTEEKMQGANMALIFGLSYVLSVILAVGVYFLVVHQAHVLSVIAHEPGLSNPDSEISQWWDNFLRNHGDNYRTFKHGMLHGTLGALMIVLPALGINALFERKGFAYIAINIGFWIVCMALMGGIMCAWV